MYFNTLTRPKPSQIPDYFSTPDPMWSNIGNILQVRLRLAALTGFESILRPLLEVHNHRKKQISFLCLFYFVKYGNVYGGKKISTGSFCGILPLAYPISRGLRFSRTTKKANNENLRDTNAELEIDPKASLPSQYTICVRYAVKQKKTILFGNFSQTSDPPPPFGNPLSKKKF